MVDENHEQGVEKCYFVVQLAAVRIKKKLRTLSCPLTIPSPLSSHCTAVTRVS